MPDSQGNSSFPLLLAAINTLGYIYATVTPAVLDPHLRSREIPGRSDISSRLAHSADEPVRLFRHPPRREVCPPRLETLRGRRSSVGGRCVREPAHLPARGAPSSPRQRHLGVARRGRTLDLDT